MRPVIPIHMHTLRFTQNSNIIPLKGYIKNKAIITDNETMTYSEFYQTGTEHMSQTSSMKCVGLKKIS